MGDAMRRLVAFIVILGLFSASVGDEGVSSARIRAREAMEQIVEKPGLSGSLQEVIDELSRRAGVDIEVDWKTIEARGASSDARVVIRASRASFGQMLDIALLQASAKGRPLAWYAEGAEVHVTTQMRALHGRRGPRGRRAAERRSERPVPSERTEKRGIGVQFDDVGIEEVVEFFRDVSGTDFHVNWGSLEAVGIGRDTPVSLRLSDVSVGRALEFVCDDISGDRGKMQRAYWVIDEGVVHIATGETLNRRTETRVFDVADLLMVAPDYPAPSLEFGTDDGDDATVGSLFDTGRNGTSDGSAAGLGSRRGENLMAVIRDSIGEDMWRPVGKGAIHIIGNRLVITQTPLGFKLLSQAFDPR
ncbi:MAG: hypothetical protein ACLFVW_01375 [Phycisphaerae bacterium]